MSPLHTTLESRDNIRIGQRDVEACSTKSREVYKSSRIL